MNTKTERTRVGRKDLLRAASIAWAALVIVGMIGACGGDSDPTSPPTTNPPVIQSISMQTVSPGDTLVITGKNFATQPSANRATFNNSLANVVPYYVTSTEMGVIVPEHAASGPMTVTSTGIKSNAVTVEVSRTVGDVWVMAGATLPFVFKVPDPTGSARYLVVPHSAASTPGVFGYTITPGTTSVFPSLHGVARAKTGTQTFAHRFERRIREEALDYIRRHGGGKRPYPEREREYAQAPDTTEFYVLNSASGSSGDPLNFTTVTAALRYAGSAALIYSDIDEPSGGFVQADYTNLGQQFDTAIYPTDTTYFGRETDVDANSKVVILFTRVVNELTLPGQAQYGFIGGFFLLNDLAPGVFPAGTSNGMEIFYSLVPDPNGESGNVFSKSGVLNIAPQILAHEFQHMISFGHRFIRLGGGTDLRYIQELWLEEGMAHIAEDLNAMNSSNIGRANLYLDDPGAVSLMGDDTLEQRGGIYLFLRYLGDQLGNSIFKQIQQNSCVGIPCVESVTGRNFFLSMADFFATLYLSNSSVPHNSKYDYTSINYPGDFDPLSVTTRLVSDGQFNGSVWNGGGDFYVLESIAAPALQLTVTAGTGTAMRLVMIRIQ